MSQFHSTTSLVQAKRKSFPIYSLARG